MSRPTAAVRMPALPLAVGSLLVSGVLGGLVLGLLGLADRWWAWGVFIIGAAALVGWQSVSWSRPRLPRSRDLALAAVAALLTCAALSLAVVSADDQRAGTHFTEFSLDRADHAVDVFNREGRPTRYRLEVRGDSKLLAKDSFTLEPGFHRRVEMPASNGSRPVDVLLYRGHAQRPYRSLRLWG